MVEVLEKQTVPEFSSGLEQIYSDVNDAIEKKHEMRYRQLTTRFKQLYGVKPAFFCRAPGRVNIIGEHIDYCGYSVLPAALEQDMIMAYVPTDDDKIVINNLDKDKFPQHILETERHQKLREDAHWSNYFLCGYKAILCHDEELKAKVTKPRGMKVLIDSWVPQAAGLSSSSAFTVCSAVLTAHINGVLDQIPLAKLAELTINSERMAGTACGGMDQTISIMGRPNTAKLIDFVPELKATDVKMPTTASLVIANSLTPSPKLMTLGTRYNKRVVECRFAVAGLALKLGKSTSFLDCPYKTMQELQVAMGASLEDMLKHVNEHLQQGGYTKQKMLNHFQEENPFNLVCDVPHVNDVENQNTVFYLYERATHVFGEAKRVHDFKALAEDASVPEAEKVQKLGALMNASQMSCHMLYDCSSDQLNELTKLAKDSGAVGSRLTGAGWGGCTVSLVENDKLESFLTKVTDYYTKQRDMGDVLWVTDDLDRYLFATQPGMGASVLNPANCEWFD